AAPPTAGRDPLTERAPACGTTAAVTSHDPLLALAGVVTDASRSELERQERALRIGSQRAARVRVIPHRFRPPRVAHRRLEHAKELRHRTTSAGDDVTLASHRGG